MTHNNSYRRNSSPMSEGGSALGPLIGIRRPRYEVLHEVLAPYLERQSGDSDLFLFVNLTSTFRHLFSEYSVAQLSRGDLNRHPRMLASELINIAAHYRNYAWKHFGRHTTVLMYYSSERCQLKLDIDPEYKANVYGKQTINAPGEFEVLRRYVAFNIKVGKEIANFIPNVHLVDTGPVDPEAWPMALIREGRVAGPSLFLSSWVTDLQYAAVGNGPVGSGFECAILKASGDHSKLITAADVFPSLLAKAKSGAELCAALEPAHFLYALAMAGDADLGVSGLQKVGMAKAAKLIASAVSEGRLPPDHPGLPQLLEDGKIAVENHPTVTRTWNLLVHQAHAAQVTPVQMAAIDAQLINRSGLGELEQANARYFADAPINLDMAFAGETY